MTKVISKRRGVNVTKTEHKLVMKMTKKAVRELCKKEYEFPEFIKSDNCWIEVATKNRGQASYGSSLGIIIDVSGFRKKSTFLSEYSSYAKDPLIGDAITDDPEVVLFAIVCHEVAHWAQMNSRLARKMKRYKDSFRKPHGRCFQSIYKYLRIALVNPLVKKKEKTVEELVGRENLNLMNKVGELKYASSQK
tara:strand:- start:1412 stop:1987 length:576 start_codon:yes stop_codon:yes gene_type:complete